MRFNYADGRMPISLTRSDGTYYLTYDQVGSLRTISDNLGNVVKKLDYDTFGSIINDSDETFAIPFGFAGGLLDKDTGLIRFGFRDYDPDIGRWTAKDPIFFAGGDVNLYGYCLNNPVNWIDPWGLSEDDPCGQQKEEEGLCDNFNWAHYAACIARKTTSQNLAGPFLSAMKRSKNPLTKELFKMVAKKFGKKFGPKFVPAVGWALTANNYIKICAECYEEANTSCRNK